MSILDPAALQATATQLGLWLTRHQHVDGSFIYQVDPIGKKPSKGYNILRHAGTCWALCTLASQHPEEYREHREALVASATGGVAYLRGFITIGGEWNGWVTRMYDPKEGGKAKLGALGLGLLAHTGILQFHDTEWNRQVAKALAEGILSLQQPDGRLASYAQLPGEEAPTRTSIYYPGEAMLGLVTYALSGYCSAVEMDRYLGAAHKAANYLIMTQRAEKIPPDAWFAQALELLYLDRGDQVYATHAKDIGGALVEDQLAGEVPPVLWGSFGPLPTNACRTAARGEGLLAINRLYRRHASLNLFAGNLRMAYGHLKQHIYPGGEGVAMAANDPSIRIDTVQHSVSFLLGLAALEDGE